MDYSYPYTVKPLNYALEALEPHIGQETMSVHYHKYYQDYVNRLNELLADNPTYQSWTLDELLMYNDTLPAAIQQSVRHNAGGVYNHMFFFDIMQPAPKDARTDVPPYNFCQFLNDTFISFDNFADLFIWYANSVFGSGYAWLVMSQEGNLRFMTTPNQDTPLTMKMQPILLLDVWEHGYYLDYESDRETYARNWFNLVNWGRVEEIHTELLKG